MVLGEVMHFAQFGRISAPHKMSHGAIIPITRTVVGSQWL